MKKLILLCLLFTTGLCSYCLEFVFPPELKWWLDEARKLNNSINLDYCFLNRDEDYEYVDINIDTKQLNPMLMKWDYDGSRFSYYSICSMIKIGDTGEYFYPTELRNIINIIDRNGKVKYLELFDKNIEINAVYWTSKSILTVCGLYKNEDSLFSDLFIREYMIGKNGIRMIEYLNDNSFPRNSIENAQLNWVEQRPDLFEDYIRY